MQLGKCILFCASQRSGSTMIHDDLHNLAGAWGRNAEWLYSEIIRHRTTQPWDDVWAAGAEKHKVGDWTTAKVMFHYTPHISDFIEGKQVTRPRPVLDFEPARFDAFQSFFADAVWVYIERGDVFEQAASMYIAETSKFWELRRGQDAPEMVPPSEIPYDTQKLRDQLRKFRAERAGWRMFFNYYGISPLRITYEDAVSNYPGYLAPLMDECGLARVDPVPERRLIKVGTGLNVEFADRLRAEMAEA